MPGPANAAPLTLTEPVPDVITQLTVTDSLKSFGKGLGSTEPEAGYSWYAGI